MRSRLDFLSLLSSVERLCLREAHSRLGINSALILLSILSSVRAHPNIDGIFGGYLQLNVVIEIRR